MLLMLEGIQPIRHYLGTALKVHFLKFKLTPLSADICLYFRFEKILQLDQDGTAAD